MCLRSLLHKETSKTPLRLCCHPWVCWWPSTIRCSGIFRHNDDLVQLGICVWPRTYFDLGTAYLVITYIDGLVQDCSISSALAMEILQSCTEPSIYTMRESTRSTTTQKTSPGCWRLIDIGYTTFCANTVVFVIMLYVYVCVHWIISGQKMLSFVVWFVMKTICICR